MRLSLNNVVSVSKKDRKQEVKHVAFHPNEPSLFIAVDDEVYGTDFRRYLCVCNCDLQHGHMYLLQ